MKNKVPARAWKRMVMLDFAADAEAVRNESLNKDT